MGGLTKPVDIESIMKNGVECQGCGEKMPADIMEDSAVCPGCELDRPMTTLEDLLNEDLIQDYYV